jgi:hypothetical protein
MNLTNSEYVVPCTTCGKETISTDTERCNERCNECWEVERRLHSYVAKSPQARAFVAETLDASYGIGVPGLIARECSALRDLLISKNQACDNTALDPVRIFSKADPEERLQVRVDDELSRLARGQAAGEDVILDLLGDLILLRIARRVNVGRAFVP